MTAMTSRAPQWAAAALTAFGVAATIEALKLPFGSVTRPGAGFFPLCLAGALTMVAASLLVRSLRGCSDAAEDVASAGRWGRATATLGALLVYALLLEKIGFAVATVLLIAFLFRVVEPQRWPIALGGALATVVVCHVLFRVWLGVRLPIGPWGV
jgi:putative tricarboxylic transport membrane protein